jgi:hypothetical protein
VPAQRSDVALLTAARAFIRQGDTAIERFTALGMPKKFITDLPGLVKSFEEASDGQRTGKAGNAAATAGIKTALAQGQLALRTLDVVIVNTFVDNPLVLAAWKQARQSASTVKDTAVTEPATQGKPAADGPAATAVPAETPPVPIALVPDALKKVS